MELSVEERQVKNLKNKVVEYIRKASVGNLVKIALLCKLKVPKTLTEKYLK